MPRSAVGGGRKYIKTGYRTLPYISTIAAVVDTGWPTMPYPHAIIWVIEIVCRLHSLYIYKLPIAYTNTICLVYGGQKILCGLYAAQ